MVAHSRDLAPHDGHKTRPRRDPEINVPGMNGQRGPRGPQRPGYRGHLDVISDTFTAEIVRLLGLGVRRLRDVERDEICWTTFADIEGNKFDLIAG
jgi:Glyoxalase-like domain